LLLQRDIAGYPFFYFSFYSSQLNDSKNEKIARRAADSGLACPAVKVNFIEESAEDKSCGNCLLCWSPVPLDGGRTLS